MLVQSFLESFGEEKDTLMEEKLKLGISACLFGENVRYDGGHKLDRFLTDTLGEYVDFVPVCPEFECGLGVILMFQTIFVDVTTLTPCNSATYPNIK